MFNSAQTITALALCCSFKENYFEYLESFEFCVIFNIKTRQMALSSYGGFRLGGVLSIFLSAIETATASTIFTF